MAKSERPVGMDKLSSSVWSFPPVVVWIDMLIFSFRLVMKTWALEHVQGGATSTIGYGEPWASYK